MMPIILPSWTTTVTTIVPHTMAPSTMEAQKREPERAAAIGLGSGAA